MGNAERRRTERYSTKQNVFAFLNSGSSQIGQIVNISRGGFAFLYTDKTSLASIVSELDMFLTSDNGYLPSIPIKIVSDEKIGVDDTIPVRKCGVQFKDLTINQEISLDSFLWNNVHI